LKNWDNKILAPENRGARATAAREGVSECWCEPHGYKNRNLKAIFPDNIPNSNRKAPNSVLVGWLRNAVTYLLENQTNLHMKNLALILPLFMPIATLGQHNANDLVIKEIHNGKVCESCDVTRAGSLSLHEKQISFYTPNPDNQFLYPDSTLNNSFTTLKVSRYYIAMSRFSLDFYPYSFIRNLHKDYSEVYWDFNKFQFRTAINGKLNSDWRDIGSLKSDPDFYFAYDTTEAGSDRGKNIEMIPAEHYHAGKFDLQINDSLTVEIRDKSTLQSVYNFSITRKRSVPDYFNFVEFSSDKSFEEILNTQISKAPAKHGPPASHYQIKGGNSALLRFADDEQYYFFGRMPQNSGIEYALNKPENWKRLGGEKGVQFINGYTYIYLDKPEPGKTVKVFLRYRHQPESINEVTVEVTRLHAGWIDIALPVLGVISLALLIFLIQKQRHKRQLTRLTHKKNEIENQLQLLSGQLNPHFLFNSLNAVQSLIRQDKPDAANQYITEVATFMRTIMDNGRKELISLSEEISIEEKYIALEQKRKSFAYTFRSECGNDLDSIDFPPLLLQPIIENSVRHGFTERIHNPTLTLTVHCDATDLVVVIVDNGIGYDPSVKAQGHGLSLTGKRIALINEKLPSMQIMLQTQSSRGLGTTTEIRLLKWLS